MFVLNCGLCVKHWFLRHHDDDTDDDDDDGDDGNDDAYDDDDEIRRAFSCILFSTDGRWG